MMWIAWLMFLLKVTTINYVPEFVMDSFESNIIVLSSNNIVPWLPWISIDVYFAWFAYGCEV